MTLKQIESDRNWDGKAFHWQTPVAISEVPAAKLCCVRARSIYYDTEHKRRPQYTVVFAERGSFHFSADTTSEAIEKANKRLVKEYLKQTCKWDWEQFMSCDQQADLSGIRGHVPEPDEHAKLWAQHTHQPQAVEPAVEDARG